MVDTTASADVLNPHGGTQVNNLINILRSNDDDDIATLKFFAIYIYGSKYREITSTKQ